MHSFPDGYHSCYVLAGLSSTQYFNDCAAASSIFEGGPLDAAMHWMSHAKNQSEDGSGDKKMIDEEDRVAAVHPVFVIPFRAVSECHDYFSRKTGF